MYIPTVQQKLERHMAFWNGELMKRPLLSIRPANVFPSTHYAANIPLLEKGRRLLPQHINVEDYLPDYLRWWEEFEATGQDAFFVAEPCTGIPWMEAIFGAEVYGGEVSFVTKHICSSFEELEDLCLDKNSPWYEKYLEFTEKLVTLVQGRFAVGQPILRGGTDTVGALVGQDEMACGLIEDPERMTELFTVIADAQRELVADQFRLIPPYHGGYCFGFYHIWAPGHVIWLQEDLAALTSPRHYNEFLRPVTERICGGYEYTLVHLHPASFFHLDDMLAVPELTAVQVNKDTGGPTVRQMMPQLCKIVESGKKLVLGMGQLDKDDIDAVYEYLPGHSTALNMVVTDVAEAHALIDYMETKSFC